MSEGVTLVNAGRRPIGRGCHGRTETAKLNDAAAKGSTRARFRAASMHGAAGAAAGGPLRITCDTLPSEANTTVVKAGALAPATQARAAEMTRPTAACTAPVDGLSGSPPEMAAAG